MATVKIKGDTADAQNKVQKLRKEVERLDREAKKPKKITIQGQQGLMGKMQAGLGKMGVAIGTATGNLITAAIKQVINYIPSIGRLGGSSKTAADWFGIDDFERRMVQLGPRLRRVFEGLEIFGNPGEEALNRADKMDALDDERRSHNSKSNAEEFAYSKAFSNIAGVNGGAMVDRLQAVLDMATSGNMQEMDKAWKLLNGMGVTWEDVEKGSTWQVLSKMLGAYHAAGADGINELEPAMQQIFGKRQMAAIRKIGDGTEMQSQAAELMAYWADTIKNEQQILEEAGKSEVTRAKAEIQGMAVGPDGVQYIGLGADEILEKETFKKNIVGSETAGPAMQAEVEKVVDEVGPFVTALGAGVVKLVGGAAEILANEVKKILPWGGDDEGDSLSNAVINVDSGQVNIDSANPLSVISANPLEVSSANPLTLQPPVTIETGEGVLKSFLTGENASATLPETHLKAPDITSSMSPTLPANDSIPELNSTVKDLIRELRKNTDASNNMSNSINDITLGQSGAVFN